MPAIPSEPGNNRATGEAAGTEGRDKRPADPGAGAPDPHGGRPHVAGQAQGREVFREDNAHVPLPRH